MQQRPMWTLIPGVPFGCRLPRKRGPYSTPNHRLTEAEPLYRRALAIQEKALGPEHADVAVSLNNLANVY